jgi:ABC-type transport system substrate-binding protein
VPGDVYTTHGLAFVSHLFRGLLRLDRELNVMPELASNFRVSHDGLTYLFQLREGLRWSDGEPCTADDFVYTWARMRKERQVTSFLMDDVASATALDDTTLEVRLHAPNNAFPYKLASPYSFPWPRHRCEEQGDDWRDPEHLVCNGPYVLESYTEEGAVMRANPHWVGARGNVGEIAYLFSYDHEMIVRGWRQGRFDIAHASDAELSEMPDTWAERLAALGTVYAALRSDAPALRDARVRRAIAHAIDRDRLVDTTTRLLRPSMRGGLLPPGVPGHSVKVGAAYDPERARELLAEAGYENGRGLPPIRLAVGGWLTRVAERLEHQLADVGIQLERVPSRSSEHPRPLPLMVREDDHADMWLTAWNADFPDPDGFFRGMLEVHDSWPTLFDEELCGLLGRARTLADQDARLRLYQEADRLLVAERATMLPIGYPRMDIVLRPWLEGVALNPLTLVQLDRAVVTRPVERSELMQEPEASPA